MKKIFAILTISTIFANYSFAAIAISEVYTFNTKQKQWYQAYLYDVFPKLSAAQLTDIEIMRINNLNEFEYNNKWINTVYNNIDTAITVSTLIASDDMIVDMAVEAAKDKLNTELGHTGEVISFIGDSLYSYYQCIKDKSMISCIAGAANVFNYSTSNISKVIHAVKFWDRYRDITKRQLSLLIVDKYLEKSIRNAQCININENYIKSLAEELQIDTGWVSWTSDYDVEFTIHEARKYCYYLNHNSFKYTGDYPENIENQAPDKPNVSIKGGVNSTSLAPKINASSYRDIENDTHMKTWWGIYKNSVLIKDFGWKTSNKYTLTIPQGILENGKDYRIAASFMDSKGNYSKAKFLSFHTKKENIQHYVNIDELPSLYFSKANNICDDMSKYDCKNNMYDILYMQMLLNADNNLRVSISEDGVWGDETRKAIMKFQAYYGLTIDGIVGFMTRLKLDYILDAIKKNMNVDGGVKYEAFLILPFNGNYTHVNTPISSVFDHTQDNDGMVIAFDGTTAKKEYNIENHGSCYMTKSKGDITLESVKYVGTDSDSSYLCYDATGVDKHRHRGIDYAVAIGTNVYASASGTVEYAGEGVSFGKYIKINHHNGFATYYGHLSSININLGDKVNSGQYIGKSGNTGNVSAHLHFDVRKCASTVGECTAISRVDPFGFMGINNLWLTDENLIEKPDMIVLDTKIDTVMNSSESYSLRGTIQNIGDAIAKDTELTFYISDDDVITSDDIVIGSYHNFGNIESKEDKTENIVVVADRSWNKKYIGACVTSSSQEVTKKNNCRVSGYIYVSENDYVDNAPYLKLYDYKIDDYATNKSDGDGKVENDEWVKFGIKLKNIGAGKATDVRVSLDTNSECVSIVHSSTSFLNIESGEETGFGNTQFAFEDCDKNEKITFSVKIMADDEYEWNDSFSFIVVDDREPVGIELVSLEVNDDDHYKSVGNGDGKVNRGEILEIYPTLKNKGEIKANHVRTYLSSIDKCVEILNNEIYSFDIDAQETKENGEYNKKYRRRFNVRIKPSCSIGHRINFHLKTTADEGVWYDDFNVIIEKSDNLGLKIIDYNITRDICNDGFWHTQNQIANPCDDIDMDLKIRNTSNNDFSKVETIIETNDSCVEVEHDGELNWYDLNASTNMWQSRKDLSFKVSSDCKPGHIVKFNVTYRAKKGEYIGDDTEEFIGTDSFTVPIGRYKIKPDLEIDRIRPRKFVFNEGDSVSFEVRVENNGDSLVKDSTWLELKIADTDSCSSDYESLGYTFVPVFGDEDYMKLTLSTEILAHWDNKYLVVEVTQVDGEIDINNNCFVGDKLTVLFNDADKDGISDTREIELGLNIHSKDTDNDGISDYEEVGDIANPYDSDGDGAIDALDTDSDNDGITDADELKYGSNPRDPNSKQNMGSVTLEPIDDIAIPVNASRHVIDLKIVNTTNEILSISATSGNTDLVVASPTDPMYLTPILNAKGHTKIRVRASAGNKSDTKEFSVYVGEDLPKDNFGWLPAVYHILMD